MHELISEGPSAEETRAVVRPVRFWVPKMTIQTLTNMHHGVGGISAHDMADLHTC